MHAAAVSMKSEFQVGMGGPDNNEYLAIEDCTAIAQPRVTKAGPVTMSIDRPD